MKTQRKQLFFGGAVIASVCSVAFVGNAHADVFDEAVLGDFVGGISHDESIFTDIGTLGLGDHSIIGSIQGDVPQDLGDTVRFVVESGLEISALSVTFTNSTFGSDTARVQATLFEVPGSDVAMAWLNGLGESVEFSDGPFGAGTYDLFMDNQFAIIGTNTDYQVNLTISEVVPAPGALALFGMAAFAGRRRRRA